jgi:5'-nucleotidase
MHILVTNDDGIQAPGLLALQKALRRIPGAKVTVIAPEQNQSAIGHRKTLHDPLRIWPVKLADGSPAHAMSGSPSDAVAVALMGYVKERVDILVSGINQGANVAQDLTYSGTVTAAMEAAIFGLPAVAVSLDSYDQPSFEVAAAFAARLAPIVAERGLPPLTLLNVNVPALPHEAIKGVHITRQGHREYLDVLIEREDPMGRPYYWIGGDRPTGDTEEEGTDLWAVAHGCISITPIRLDMTAHDLMDAIKGWGLDF